MRYTEFMTKPAKKTMKASKNESSFQPTKLAVTVAALGAVTIALFGVIAATL